jgi:hypothetical protein|tara:strand:- start:533 stop:772 length:240 start_codon:yes stop_codon:yes gene_type:complete
MDMMLWNILLTVTLALLGWWGQSMYKEVQRLSILLNRTREEVAKEYVTKTEVHHDMNRIIERLDHLDGKIDRFFEGIKK